MSSTRGQLDSALVPSIIRHRLPQPGWTVGAVRGTARGEYVLTEVVASGCYTRLDVVPGADLPLYPGATFVGVWGTRHSSTSISGGPPGMPVPAGFECDFLAIGGIVGIHTDYPRDGAPPTRVRILGGVYDEDEAVTMRPDPDLVSSHDLPPVVMVVGSSAEIGKTQTTASLLTAFKDCGRPPAAVKLTGSGRMRDLASYEQSGVLWSADFVDAGLETTYDRDGGQVADAAVTLLATGRARGASVAVGEIGGDLISSGGPAVLADDRVRRALRAVVCVGADPLACRGLASVLDELGVKAPRFFAPMRRNNRVSAAITRGLVADPVFEDLTELAQAVRSVLD